jgi:polysaccharide pyruvyl transferase WcaK-like protein
MKSGYNIAVMGIEFYGGNLGCAALAFSFLSELQQIALKSTSTISVSLLGYNEKTIEPIEGISGINIIRIRPKSRKFWKRVKDCFMKSDMIFDFTLGDSFSDIYGMKRFIISSMLKQEAINCGGRLVLAPQTYGPYQSFLAKAWASEIMRRSSIVFSRDQKSAEIVRKMIHRDAIIVTDIAFALPFQMNREKVKTNKIRVGINPSGLLWNGGYTGNNQFGLKTDYQKYCKDLIESLLKMPEYEIYLIPHVNPREMEGKESDLKVCEILTKAYSNVKVVRNICTPMDAKTVIASMDILVAARMHATVAGLSTETATIPVAYSSKFEGLFGNIEYPYIVDARNETTDEALRRTMQWIENRDELKKATIKSMEIVREKQNVFRQELMKLFEQCGQLKEDR